MWARAEAFLRRDFLFHWSYKFSFVYDIGSLFSSLVALYFVGRMIGVAPPAVAAYGTDYFTFAQNVRIAQIMGTLEAMMVTPTHPFEVVVLSASYTYIWTLLRSALYVLLGALLFDADLGRTNVLSALVFMILTVLTFAGIGLASAALTLYLKQSDPLTSLIGGVSFLFGGIVYPVQSLPEMLQPIAWALPMTHAVEGLRRAVFSGASVGDLWSHAAVLGAWSLVAFPLSFVLLRWVMRALSREGSFGAY